MRAQMYRACVQEQKHAKGCTQTLEEHPPAMQSILCRIVCLMRACVQASRCASRTRKSGATSAALKPTSTPRKRGSRRGVRVPRPCAAAERTIVRKPVPLCAAVEACKKSSFTTRNRRVPTHLSVARRDSAACGAACRTMCAVPHRNSYEPPFHRYCKSFNDLSPRACFLPS